MKKGTTLKSNIEKVYGAGPVQYQRGWTQFYKLKIKVTPDVLIPRPETELLVDEILKVVKSSELRVQSKNHEENHSKLPTPNSPTVLDIGTGSGCIAVSIAKNLSDAKIIAADISQKALEVAKQNAKFHHLENQIIFIQSDLLSFIQKNPVIASDSKAIPETKTPEIASSSRHGGTPRNDVRAPDIIVANLPYIPSANLMLIDPLVADFEPKIALDGGQDGFDLYRQLFSQICDNNFYPKILLIEIDDTQAEIAPQEAKKYFPNAQIEKKKDLNKIDRFLTIQF